MGVYAFSNHIDAHLTCAAMLMAIQRQKPTAGLIFHSDRSSPYASYPYRNLLLQHRVRQSMSRRGNPYDNVVAENFFNCLKCALVHFQHFHTRFAAKAAIFRYIEAYYNAVRPHNGIDWIAPNAFEKTNSHPAA